MAALQAAVAQQLKSALMGFDACQPAMDGVRASAQKVALVAAKAAGPAQGAGVAGRCAWRAGRAHLSWCESG